MGNILNLDEFERLSGRDFTRYTVKMQNFLIGDDFVKYFIQKNSQMDVVHLELALYWLGKSGLPAAYLELANFIDHPNQTFRFLSIGFLVEMKSEIDARIMSRVIEALDRNLFPCDRPALASLLKKPAAKEAEAIAVQYLANMPRE